MLDVDQRSTTTSLCNIPTVGNPVTESSSHRINNLRRKRPITSDRYATLRPERGNVDNPGQPMNHNFSENLAKLCRTSGRPERWGRSQPFRLGLEKSTSRGLHPRASAVVARGRGNLDRDLTSIRHQHSGTNPGGHPSIYERYGSLWRAVNIGQRRPKEGKGTRSGRRRPTGVRWGGRTHPCCAKRNRGLPSAARLWRVESPLRMETGLTSTAALGPRVGRSNDTAGLGPCATALKMVPLSPARGIALAGGGALALARS